MNNHSYFYNSKKPDWCQVHHMKLLKSFANWDKPFAKKDESKIDSEGVYACFVSSSSFFFSSSTKALLKILPTAVFGSSFLNSYTLGTL